jgi:hypothetical protein
MVLDAGEQREMLAELVWPAQSKIIECACGKFQSIFAPRRKAVAKTDSDGD